MCGGLWPGRGWLCVAALAVNPHNSVVQNHISPSASVANPRPRRDLSLRSSSGQCVAHQAVTIFLGVCALALCHLPLNVLRTYRATEAGMTSR